MASMYNDTSCESTPMIETAPVGCFVTDTSSNVTYLGCTDSTEPPVPQSASLGYAVSL